MQFPESGRYENSSLMRPAIRFLATVLSTGITVLIGVAPSLMGTKDDQAGIVLRGAAICICWIGTAVAWHWSRKR